MFPVFHLAWSSCPAAKTFFAGLRIPVRWLVDLLGVDLIRRHLLRDKLWVPWKRATKPKFVAQCRPALYFSQHLSSTRNKCFCCVTSWSREVKNGKHRQRLATKQCCATSWWFLYLVFRRLKSSHRDEWSILFRYAPHYGLNLHTSFGTIKSAVTFQSNCNVNEDGA